MGAQVYRFFDADGGLIYVGCTTNLPARLATHQNKQRPWWTTVVRIDVEHFDSLSAARAAERAAISAEHPPYGGPDRVELARRSWEVRRQRYGPPGHMGGPGYRRAAD
jgi:predicted GIY-YIG superfamily endonuclease